MNGQLKLFDFRSEAVSTSAEVDMLIGKHSPVAIGVSGGKDSSVAAWATLEHLKRIGHYGKKVLVHSHLGRIEWADSLPNCQRLADRLDVELVTVERAAGGMVERWETRWRNNVQRFAELSCVKLILPWSTPAMRFCTSELKTAIICRELIYRYPGQQIVSVTGIRRQESSARAKMPVTSIQPRLLSTTHKTEGLNWNPIIDWTEEQIWDCHRINHLPIHEAYTTYGSSRVSCSFCIMSSLEDLIKSALCPGNQDVYLDLVELEVISSFGFQSSRWLGDIAPKLLSPETKGRLAKAKGMAAIRERAEARIPNHLLYVKGWPTCIPTRSEAELLADVRRTVAVAVGLSIQCDTPDTIIERYEYLMVQKEQKNRAK